MIVTEYNIPWKHLVLDNFLEPDDFNYVESYINSKYDLMSISRPVAEVHTVTSNTEFFQKLSPYIYKIRDLYYKHLNYSCKDMPDIVYPYVELAICSPGFRYQRIHTDDRNFKVMTTVLYVTPIDGDGTELYSENKKSKYIKKLEWKQNRALCFVGTENPNYPQTWHNYGNTKPYGRASINLILSRTELGKY